MSFELHRQKHIEHELAKIVRREPRKTAGALTASGGCAFDSTVHESRRSLKKVRAVTALLEQAGADLPLIRIHCLSRNTAGATHTESSVATTAAATGRRRRRLSDDACAGRQWAFPDPLGRR
jgi:hypothetical protein